MSSIVLLLLHLVSQVVVDVVVVGVLHVQHVLDDALATSILSVPIGLEPKQLQANVQFSTLPGHALCRLSLEQAKPFAR